MPVLTHQMAGIDHSPQSEVDRLAPWPGNAGCMDHIDAHRCREGGGPGNLYEGDVDVVTVFVFDQIDGKDHSRRLF